MGNPKAFLEIHRQEAGYRPVHDRIHDFGEVEQTLNTRDRKLQASRCMDCGVPFCHWTCPLGNKAPEWNDALWRGEWELAYRLLSATNPFPEFTGRICPALCEKACVLNLTIHEPTTNREDECAITEAAFREGYITPASPKRNGKKVAVIGSGPAGLAAANSLNLMGYTVTVFEQADSCATAYQTSNSTRQSSTADSDSSKPKASPLSIILNSLIIQNTPTSMPSSSLPALLQLATSRCRAGNSREFISHSNCLPSRTVFWQVWNFQATSA